MRHHSERSHELPLSRLFGVLLATMAMLLSSVAFGASAVGAREPVDITIAETVSTEPALSSQEVEIEAAESVAETTAPSPETTASAVPTTAAPTTALPTTAAPTTAAPTTALPTTALPTTAVPTTAVSTTAVPTTEPPSTTIQSSSGPIAYAQTSDVDPGVAGSVIRLYYAVFDRAPDAGGEAYWVDRYVTRKSSLVHIAGSFMEAPEWTRTYGVLDDAAFIELLYNNVLDRAPEPAGNDYWMGRLASGTSRTTVLLGFSESPELIAATGTAQPKPPPPPPAPPTPPAGTFPPLPANSGSGKRIVYSNSGHRVWLVEKNNQVQDSYLVSGRRNTPNPGTYSVFSKSPVAWAGHDGITMRHMVRFTFGASLAIGFHSIPRYADGRPMQSSAQLGSWRSSGCIRQRDDKAEKLYNWAPVGTTVVVLR